MLATAVKRKRLQVKELFVRPSALPESSTGSLSGRRDRNELPATVEVAGDWRDDWVSYIEDSDDDDDDDWGDDDDDDDDWEDDDDDDDEDDWEEDDDDDDDDWGC